MTVQQLLTRAAGQPKARADPRGIDGGIAKPPTKSDTVKAIKAFQSLVGIGPTSLIRAGEPGWRSLVQRMVSSNHRRPGRPAFRLRRRLLPTGSMRAFVQLGAAEGRCSLRSGTSGVRSTRCAMAW